MIFLFYPTSRMLTPNSFWKYLDKSILDCCLMVTPDFASIVMTSRNRHSTFNGGEDAIQNSTFWNSDGVMCHKRNIMHANPKIQIKFFTTLVSWFYRCTVSGVGLRMFSLGAGGFLFIFYERNLVKLGEGEYPQELLELSFRSKP